MLEKILEEIEKKQVMLQPFDGVDRPTGIINVDVVKEIIRKHMNDGKDTNVPTNDGWILIEVCPMPENDGMYEVTRLVNGQYETAYIKQEGGWSSCIGPMEGEVIAWKLGPEPYRPEEGGDNSDNNL